MKETFFIPALIVIAALSASAFDSTHKKATAQNSATAHSRREDDILIKLEKQLELSPEQKEKVRAVMDEGEIQMESLEKQVGELEGKMRKMMEERAARIRALLTEAQKKKFEDLKSRIFERVHEKMDS